MSNKLEAALGGEPTNTFTDREGEVYEVFEADADASALTLRATTSYGDVRRLNFLKADATKIIALIAEAAKEKPQVQTPEQIAAFAKRWDARVEAGQK